MADKTERAKARIVRKIIDEAVSASPARHKSFSARFVEQLYADSPPDDLAQRSADDLTQAALSLLDFAGERQAGQTKVRVFLPARRKGSKWKTDRARVEIVTDDMPFLVDSVGAELERIDTAPLLIVHPVMGVTRDERGSLTDVLPEAGPDEDVAGTIFESVMTIEIADPGDVDMLDRVCDTLQSVLADVRNAVQDWLPMRRQVTRIAADFDGPSPGVKRDQAAEVEDFLHWLHDDHYTFLGYRRFEISGKGKARQLSFRDDGNLGVLRKRSLSLFEGMLNDAPLPAQLAQFCDRDSVLLIIKANKRATVHRRVHYDVVCIKIFDAKGAVCGLHMFAGLFTADVYTNSPNFVPVLKRKIDRIRDRVGFRKHSHDDKRLQNIMENLPRDELFESSDAYLEHVATGILHLQERSRTALFVRRDEFERFVSCLVYVPRDRFDTELRLAITEILVRRFDGRLSSFFTQVTDSPLARLHVIVATVPGTVPAVDEDAIEEEIAAAARAWQDELYGALIDTLGEGPAQYLHNRYAYAFPASYREQFDVDSAVFDIGKVEDLIAGAPIAMHLYRADDAADGVQFKVYTAGTPLMLSDVLPVIENMGFKVRGEMPFEISPRGSVTGAGPFWLHDFGMTVASGRAIDVDAVRDGVHEAFHRVWSGAMESDGFNKLVALASLAWREVVILRAYAKYLRQAAFPFSQSYIEDAFVAHPDVARLLVDLFVLRFDPKAHSAKAKAATSKKITALEDKILDALEAISSADEDRVLRRYLNLIQSTLRTNYFQTNADGEPKSYVSLKLNSQTVEDLPLPRPWREITVYSPRVEAIHLRGGPVARGGLRWSDRREDFRSEILGLVKAQMVKNAVIVPTGSKGGFVVKNPPAGGRDAMQAEGIACYQTMQRALLDITDNIVDGKTVHPKDVVRHDPDDPYLVVAADKGTATFSDIANAISEDYGFWLGDAFASGGSVGYDHKAMGITARGAWESVKRHFREMGIDTQRQAFTAAGCGDMSGDVFGNGMLLSKHIKLVAAFNHMHIFIDPDPDPARTFKERKRLFKLPRSGWADYDTTLISKGGGIFERSAKRIKLTPEIKALLDIDESEVTPTALISAILKMRVDLLWFGGIGTYIKETGESHGDASDRANDGLRINGNQVRAKVIGEGANLGVTQRGRIECGANGVRLNTDAIDNSAGVDCSDHEVNIKILLNGLVASGKLTMTARNKLLTEMTDDVADLVLRDNYQQTQTISFIQSRGANVLETQARTMKMMERDGLLNRALEFLPSDDEIAERLARNEGLTRPEIAVLLPYSKMWLYERLVKSTLPDDPLMEDDLVSYFPGAIQKKYPAAIRTHRLRREIIATVATNSLINRVGASFLTSIMDRTGVGPEDVARAYMVTRAAYGLRDLWTAIESLDNKVAADVQIEMLHEVNRMIERSVLWILRNEPLPLEMAKTIERLGPAVDGLKSCFRSVITPDVTSYVEDLETHYAGKGVPRPLAREVACLYRLAAANDISRLAQSTKRSVTDVAAIYFAAGARFGLGWLRVRTAELASGSHWQRLAVSASVEELFAQQSQLTQRIMSAAPKGKFAAAKALETWAAANKTGVERFDALMDELRGSGDITLAMLTVANLQLAALCGG